MVAHTSCWAVDLMPTSTCTSKASRPTKSNVPLSVDVLFGRGCTPFCHPPNFFLYLVDSFGIYFLAHRKEDLVTLKDEAGTRLLFELEPEMKSQFLSWQVKMEMASWTQESSRSGEDGWGFGSPYYRPLPAVEGPKIYVLTTSFSFIWFLWQYQ